MKENLKSRANIVFYIAAVVLIVFALKEILSTKSLTLVSGVPLALAIAILGYLLIDNFDKVRKAVKEKQARNIIALIITVLLYAGVGVFIYMIALNNDEQIDFTSKKIYSLSDQSVKILKNLENKVEVFGFYGIYEERFEFGRQAMDDLLQQYTSHSKEFHYRLYNINKEPDMAEKFEVKVPGTVIVRSDKKKELLTELSEQNLTNAIIRVSRERAKKVYFLEGHGERSIEAQDGRGISQLKLYLENQQYTTETLKLSLTGGIVPTDCDLLIVPGLLADIFPIEWKGILDYIKRGGNLFIMIDPGAAPQTVKWLEMLGLDIGNNILLMNQVSQVDAMMGNFYTIVTNSYGNHPITKDFPFQTVYDKVRSVDSAKTLPTGVTASEILSSGPGTHAQNVQIQPTTSSMQRSGKVDREGPISIGIALKINTLKWEEPKIKLDKEKDSPVARENITAEKDSDVKSAPDEQIGEPDGEARIVVIGDSEFAMDYMFANRKGNMDFVLNTIAWLADETDTISIRPKMLTGTPLFLNREQQNNLLWWSVILLPVLVLGIGLIVRLMRKKRHLI